jgi:uncharacterized membrane protein YfcA
MIALILAVPMGASLGALGGGGSNLTLPIFVIIAGIPPREAVAMSMVVVGGTSLVGAGLHFWRGNFNVKAALVFAASGTIAAYFGSYLTPMVSQRLLLGFFAAIMLAAGLPMVRGQAMWQGETKCHVGRCLVVGAFVGALTGFLGVGGGFVIVPALVLFAGVETKQAVGTSLAIITLAGAGGLLGHIQNTSFDWPLTLGFLGLALAGMFGGLWIADNIPGPTLKKSFGWFVIVLAILVGAMSALGINLPSKAG